MKKMLAFALAAPLVLAAKPVIDDAHDRVQTTLDPMMDRIGTLVPRSAKERPRGQTPLVCGGVVMAMPQRDSWQHAKAVGSCAAMTEDGKKCT